MRLGQPRFAMLIRIENYRRAKTAVRQLFQERVALQNARDQITIIITSLLGRTSCNRNTSIVQLQITEKHVAQFWNAITSNSTGKIICSTVGERMQQIYLLSLRAHTPCPGMIKPRVSEHLPIIIMFLTTLHHRKLRAIEIVSALNHLRR